MSTVPPRPEDDPDKWIMAFWYFDKLHTSYDLSQSIPFDSEEEAREAATKARSHNGGGIRVMYAYAYPPVGATTEPFVVEFV